MARITHPVLTTGTVKSHFDVVFTDGAADVQLTPFMRDWYLNRGYKIDETPTADGDLSGLIEASDAAGDVIDLETLTVAQLRSLAGIRSVDVPKRATKAELIYALSFDVDPIPDFAIVELSDGTIIGDGKSLATLPVDERTAAPDATED
jgi:hypothetical protein